MVCGDVPGVWCGWYVVMCLVPGGWYVVMCLVPGGWCFTYLSTRPDESEGVVTLK